MSYCFDPDVVIELNGRLTNAPAVVLDRLKLESALARPHHTYDGTYLHRTLVERTAALLDGLCQAHAFMDGNKRTAWMCSVLYLDLNGVAIRDMDEAEAGGFVEGVVLHEYDVETASVWFAERII
ncbi:type II toxin-antitoxin system death-on-curing family toxin [Oerskovia sp. NPDC060338]|uniref:type II toxin-antitoxin system death-on-curing family toxin n=1 Tax=Oerskovia sp. NPDC060338 TaxID=3347100 RepID=UPI00365B6990